MCTYDKSEHKSFYFSNFYFMNLYHLVSEPLTYIKSPKITRCLFNNKFSGQSGVDYFLAKMSREIIFREYSIFFTIYIFVTKQIKILLK